MMNVPIRLLPLLLIFATIILSLRVGEVWHQVKFSQANAEAKKEEAHPEEEKEEKEEAQEAHPTEGEEPVTEEAPATIPQATLPQTNYYLELNELTDSEIDVLEKLYEKKQVIEMKETAITEREKELQVVEHKIDQKIEQLSALELMIKDLLKQADTQEAQHIDSMVKIYENMKAKDAAKIFEDLDMGILLTVVERMKEKKVAPILAQMNPNKARDITEELMIKMQERKKIALP